MLSYELICGNLKYVYTHYNKTRENEYTFHYYRSYFTTIIIE